MAITCFTPSTEDNWKHENHVCREILRPDCSDPPRKQPKGSPGSRQSGQYRNHLARSRVLANLKLRLETEALPGSDHALAYLAGKYRQGLSANTIRASATAVISFLSFLGGAGKSLEDLTRSDIEAYVEAEQDRGLSILSVDGKIRSLYPFISFLVTQNTAAPAILEHRLQVKKPETLPRAIPPDDLAKLLAVLDNIRDRAMVLLLLRTGMRIGELLELTVMDINLVEHQITIYIGEKNYQGRVVYFGEDAGEALLAWLDIREPSRNYLFYGRKDQPLSYVAAWFRISTCFKKAGLSHKPYSPHCLRHTFATEVLNAGMRLEVVQQLLGHKDIEMTRRYARLSDSTREEEYFRAMSKIEKGGACDEDDRFSHKLQAVLEKKKLFPTHD
ncbi:MAG: tyrosine-type recombinase/integrase [Desulfobulbaceae bacterium]|nr:tyrosine-type recombinase/integrase [Desulfobulbaceae bacterium]